VSVIGDGPPCGSPEASTYLMAVYLDADGVHFIDKWYCCHRHIPHPNELLSEGTELIEVVVADSRYTTVAGDGAANTTGITFESAGWEEAANS